MTKPRTTLLLLAGLCIMQVGHLAGSVMANSFTLWWVEINGTRIESTSETVIRIGVPVEVKASWTLECSPLVPHFVRIELWNNSSKLEQSDVYFESMEVTTKTWSFILHADVWLQDGSSEFGAIRIYNSISGVLNFPLLVLPEQASLDLISMDHNNDTSGKIANMTLEYSVSSVQNETNRFQGLLFTTRLIDSSNVLIHSESFSVSSHGTLLVTIPRSILLFLEQYTLHVENEPVNQLEQVHLQHVLSDLVPRLPVNVVLGWINDSVQDDGCIIRAGFSLNPSSVFRGSEDFPLHFSWSIMHVNITLETADHVMNAEDELVLEFPRDYNDILEELDVVIWFDGTFFARGTSNLFSIHEFLGRVPYHLAITNEELLLDGSQDVINFSLSCPLAAELVAGVSLLGRWFFTSDSPLEFLFEVIMEANGSFSLEIPSFLHVMESWTLELSIASNLRSLPGTWQFDLGSLFARVVPSAMTTLNFSSTSDGQTWLNSVNVQLSIEGKVVECLEGTWINISVTLPDGSLFFNQWVQVTAHGLIHVPVQGAIPDHVQTLFTKLEVNTSLHHFNWSGSFSHEVPRVPDEPRDVDQDMTPFVYLLSIPAVPVVVILVRKKQGRKKYSTKGFNVSLSH